MYNLKNDFKNEISSNEYVEQSNKYIHTLFSKVRSHINTDEQLKMNFDFEKSLFIRFHNGKVRQTTHVLQEIVKLELINGQKSAKKEFTLAQDLNFDFTTSMNAIEQCRIDFLTIDEDPFLSPLTSVEKSYEYFPGDDFDSDFAKLLCDSFQGKDFNGLWTSGPIIRASLTSTGADHFFATNNHFLDYSIYNGILSIKSSIAGSKWNCKKWGELLEDSLQKLKLMDLPTQRVLRGQYRVYLSPDATAELINMFNWGGLSQDAYQRGDSALAKLVRNEVELSPKFTLIENFNLGLCPQFNSVGEVADKKLSLIENGILKNLLTSTRSFKEYGIASNHANSHESVRSPEVLSGNLKKQDILNQLDTGIYISNLHYLNWSEQTSARVTGMTRFACFWVEKGIIKGPIEHLRFDESILEAFGNKLEAVTEERELIPNVETYGSRHLGGMLVPGMLINNFTFTL